MSASRRKIGQRSNELGVAEAFVEHLRAREGMTVTDFRPGEDRGDPDFLCLANGEPRGIEIVNCYGSQADAQALWNAGEAALYENIRGHVPVHGPDPELLEHASGNPLVAALERTMRQTPKTYAVKTWLVLNASGVLWPLYDDRSGPQVIAQTTKPVAVRGFLDVYVYLSGNGRRRFFRLSDQDPVAKI